MLCAVLSLSVVSDSFWPMDYSLSGYPWRFSRQDSLGKNTGVGGHSLLQGIFLTQGSNPGVSHFRRILYRLSHQESPEKWSISCHSSKQRCQGLQRISPFKCEFLSPKVTWKEEYLHNLAATTLQPLPLLSIQEFRMWNMQDTSPRQLRSLWKEWY